MRRWGQAQEVMDQPGCDPVLLARTYAQFSWVNRVVSGWRGLYLRRIRPLLARDRPVRILDIGSGGGDIALALARWTQQDRIEAQVVGIDPDPRAHAFAQNRRGRANLPGERLEFRQVLSSELRAANERFDVVISNHLIHHLSPQELAGLWRDSSSMATGLVLHSDILRSRTAALLFGFGTLPLAGTSLTRRDGLTSIRRSYRPLELAQRLPAGWQVEAGHPFRNLVSFQPEGSGG